MHICSKEVKRLVEEEGKCPDCDEDILEDWLNDGAYYCDCGFFLPMNALAHM